MDRYYRPNSVKILPMWWMMVLACLGATSLSALPATDSVPFISQPLMPDAASPGGSGFTLTVQGAGFVFGSVVYWNGAALTTQFVSSDRLTATVPGSDIAVAGSASVTVANPGPGEVSNAVAFEINAATPSVFFSSPPNTVGNSPVAQAAGDFNGDRNLDLVTANYGDGTVSVLLGNGDGTFHTQTAYNTALGPLAVVSGDFNGDGNLDLAVADSVSNAISVLLGNGDGTFQEHVDYPVGWAPGSIVTADFNGNGKLDLAAVNAYDDSISVLLGNGDGTFQSQVTYPTATDPSWLATGDFNGDGKLDVASADYGSDSVSVLLGNGDGTFQPHVEYATGPFPISVAAGSLSGDGILDLAVANENPSGTGSISVLLGNGDGTFQTHVDYPTAEFTTAVVAGDFNGDNHLDVAVSNLDSQSLCVLLGRGDGTLQPGLTQPVPGGVAPRGITTADFNDDGRLDLVTGTDNANAVSVSLQTTAVLSPSSLAFGHQGVGTTSPAQTVTLANNGATAFTLSAVSFGGANAADFAETNNCANSLAAGASCAINVTFAPTTYGNRAAILNVTDSAVGSPQSVPLSGFGDAPVAYLSPTSVGFPEQVVGTTSLTTKVSLTDTGTLPLDIATITLGGANSSSFLERNNCPAVVPPNRTCSISLSFRPLSAGSLSAEVSVSDNAAGSPQIVTLSGTATFFQVSPSYLNFGDVPVGQTSAPQTVTVTNKASHAQAISTRLSGRNPGDFAETNNCGSSLGPGASCSIIVTFSPKIANLLTATLQINGGGGGVLSVALSGTGTQ
jgi:hypothetical protein